MAVPALPVPWAAAGCAGEGRTQTRVSGFQRLGNGAAVVGTTCAAEMWRAAARHLSRSSSRAHKRLQELHQGLQNQQTLGQRKVHVFGHCRTCSSAVASALRGSQDVGWSSSCPFGSGLDNSPQRLSCLEESVFALDAALHDVVNLPWIANQLLPQVADGANEQLQVVEEIGGEIRSPHRSNPVAGFAGAAERVGELEKVCKEPQKPQKETRAVPQPRQAMSKQAEARKEAKKRYWELYERQKKIETEAWTTAVADYKTLMEEMCRKNIAPNLPVVQSLMVSWFEPLRDAIAAEQKECKDMVHSKFRSVYGSFLLQLPPDVLAVITMHKVMGLCLEQHQRCDSQNSLYGAVRVVNATLQIGEAVEMEIGIRRVTAKEKKKKKKGGSQPPEDLAVSEEERLAEEAKAKARKLRSLKVKKLVALRKLRWVDELLKNSDDAEPWGDEVRAKVGARLLQLLVETAIIRAPASQSGDDTPEIRPAFRHTSKVYQSKSRKKITRNYGVIEMDSYVFSELGKSAYSVIMPYMPMIIPPLRWTSYKDGGHLHLRGSVMRTHGSKAQLQAVRAVSRKEVQAVYQALDTLGATAWKINKRVLAVVESLWQNGGGVANLVEQDDVLVSAKPENGDEDELKKWKREYMIAKRINSERHSLRCDTNLKLQVAREMAEEECFYYPHNVDFRGRAYPMHPHLNHLGSDMCRGILQFAKGRPLGGSGLRWLKISLASLYGGGFGKLSLDGRVAFADDNMDKVFDSAERPLDGERWWAQAEDPLQCLAVCMDLRDALNSKHPERYISHLPVHQDGSCNGLQHYAALGRDQIGAMSVNLIDGDRPADVYSSIAKRVHAIMEKDALEDPAVSRNAAQARLLIGQVDRKLVKQTVMTSVYGVTFIGARAQIMNRLMERNTFSESKNLFSTGNYAAKVTLGALGEMFKEARCIMTWLGECARLIAAQNIPVRWKTPLGLPVVQPYRKDGRHIVSTSLQVLSLRKENDKQVSPVRQRTAFPPNFVHSLDGTHMMMTAIACGEAGLVFAGVHDSYWTHAGDVEKMNQILREKFVELYSQPILENLLQDFKTQFPELKFPDVPGRGKLDLNEVLKSTYFFN